MLEHKINELGLKFILYGYLNEYTKNCENKRSVLPRSYILTMSNNPKSTWTVITKFHKAPTCVEGT